MRGILKSLKLNFFILDNQAGASTIILAAVAAAVVAAMSLVLPDLFQTVDKNTRMLVVKSSATLVKENIMSTLDNDAALAATIRHASNNPALACLQTVGATCAFGPAGTLINLVEADNTIVSDAGNPLQGFNLSGQQCNTYGDLATNDNCLFRFQVRIHCDGPCTPTIVPAGAVIPSSPKLRISAVFDFTAKSLDKGIKLNNDLASSPYQLNFIRNGVGTKTVGEFCTSVGGTFDQLTQQCSSPLAPGSFDCRNTAGPHAWFVGFDAGGVPVCANDASVGAGCPAGSGIIAYNENGQFVCSGY